MKKLFHLILIPLILAVACNKYDEDIENINNRLDKIENTHVASLQKQIDAIKTSLPQLEKTDAELKGYIQALQDSYAELKTSLEKTDQDIEALRNELQDDIQQETDEALANVLKQLEGLRADLQNQLNAISATIQTLTSKDAELDKKIADLKKYVESITASQGSIDWINATFVTLDHHNSLVSDVAVIKGQIESVTQSISDLDSRINEKYAQLSSEYAQAIQNVKEQITAAYTDMIKSLISNLEQSLKNWVNEQLDGYYTIAEVEAKLSSMMSVWAAGNEALKEQIDNLSEATDQAKVELTDAYKKAIEEAISSYDGVITSFVAAEVTSAATKMNTALAEVNGQISTILARLSSAESKIATIQEQIYNINQSLSSLQDLYDTLTGTILEMEASDQYAEEEITKLKQKTDQLASRMEEIRQYVTEELPKMMSWASATFATVDQMTAALAEIEGVRASVEALDAEWIGKIDQIIDSAVNIVKEWVSDELDSYCTIARMEGRFSQLVSEMESGDAAVRAEIEALAQTISGLKSEYISTCAAIVETAINNNNGIIDDKIASKAAELRSYIDQNVNEINVAISDLETRLGLVEGKVSTIENQITYILNSLGELRTADQSLQNYISYVQAVIPQIQETLASVDANIQDVTDKIGEEDAKVRAEVEARLLQLKTELENEINQLKSTLANLMVRDQDLQQQIDALQTYVDEELASQKDWAEATFATLGHFSYLSAEITQIKAQLENVNSGMTALEARLNTEMANDIKEAVETLDAEVQAKINQMMGRVTSDISMAKSEIADAYNEAIRQAIAVSETSIKSWVSDKLTGYYTIAEVTALLDGMSQQFDEKLNAQRAYFEGLINSLASEVRTGIGQNSHLISQLTLSLEALEGTVAEHAQTIAQNSSMISEHSDRIVQNALAISNNANQIEVLKSDVSSLTSEMRARLANIESTMNQSEASQTEINQKIEEIRADYTSKINVLQSLMDGLALENRTLAEENAKKINSNTSAIAANAAAIQSLQTSVNASIARNADEIAKNAADIATTAELISRNSTAITNNADAIAKNTEDIVKMQQELITAKEEMAAAYQAALQQAIESLGGSLNAEVVTQQINAINGRIDELAVEVDQAIKNLESRVDDLELEMEGIQQAMADIIQDIAELKEGLAGLMKRIQSVTYIPKYSDGKATVVKTVGEDNGIAEFDFQISPITAVEDIAANWQAILSMKVVSTMTRAVSFIDMPILSFEADAATGVISITASGENLSNRFYYQEEGMSVALYISDNVNTITSEFVPMWADVPAYRQLRLIGTSYPSLGTSLEFNDGEISLISTESNGEEYILTFDGVLRKIEGSLFYNSTSESAKTFTGIVFPPTIRDLYYFGGGPIKDVYISDLSTWLTTSFKVTSGSMGTMPTSSNPLVNGGTLYLDGVALSEITVPDDIDRVSTAALINAKLTKVTIPANVKSIGSHAFSNSISSAPVVYMESSEPPTCGSNAFARYSSYYEKYQTASMIYVPAGSADAYKSNSGWEPYSSNIVEY